MTVDLRLTDAHTDLIGEGFDAALRLVALEGSPLVARLTHLFGVRCCIACLHCKPATVTPGTVTRQAGNGIKGYGHTPGWPYLLAKACMMGLAS